MSTKEQIFTGSGVPRVAARPARESFFDSYERDVLHLEVFLLIASFVGAGFLGMILVILRSVHW